MNASQLVAIVAVLVAVTTVVRIWFVGRSVDALRSHATKSNRPVRRTRA